MNSLNKLEKGCISSMNYFFLREAFDKNKDIDEINQLYEVMLNELEMFLSDIALINNIPIEYKNILKQEMDEGEYIDKLNIDEISEKLKKSIIKICGTEVYEVHKLYLDIAKEIKENTK